MTKTPLILLRTALQHALDELQRINAAHSCVRPDVTFAAMDALRKTFTAPIEHASEIEQRIVGKLINDLLDGGHALSIWNGGDEAELAHSTDAGAIYKALAASDEDEISVYVRSKPGEWRRRGWIQLVWGNDTAVISDYSVNIEDLVSGAINIASELEG